MIDIDLTRDLPKVREHFDEVLAHQPSGRCKYAGPCVIGAMIPRNLRDGLDNANVDDTSVQTLVVEGFVTVQAGQLDDLVRLQQEFDSGDLEQFLGALRAVEAKYLKAPAHKAGEGVE